MPGSFRATLAPGATSRFVTAANARNRVRGRFKKCVVAEGRAEKGENDSEALPILFEHILLRACVCFFFCFVFWSSEPLVLFPLDKTQEG